METLEHGSILTTEASATRQAVPFTSIGTFNVYETGPSLSLDHPLLTAVHIVMCSAAGERLVKLFSRLALSEEQLGAMFESRERTER